MSKIDPYKSKEKYFAWKNRTQNGIKGVSEQNSQMIKKYLSDMEIGHNVAISNKKGARSYARLTTLQFRMMFLARKFEAMYQLTDITQITEEQLLSFFSQMRSGEIKKSNGGQYKAVRDFCKTFKAFWHWHQKVNRKQGIQIGDITTDLDTTGEKPEWVYLTEDEVKKIAQRAKYEYRVLIWFLMDTGIRAPTELVNVKVNDFLNNYTELDIKVSKTFGRKIKLKLCSDLMREYVQQQQLQPEDYVFPITPFVANRYLKRLAVRIFGDRKSPGGGKYSELTLYDFRHISCCYWVRRIKKEMQLKYRFGWKKSDKIYYYSEFIGMRDDISDEDMLVDVTKTEIEQKLQKSEQENELLKERIELMEQQMSRILEITNEMYGKMSRIT